MSYSPQFRMDAQKVLVITVSYLLITSFQALYNHSLLRSSSSIGPSETYSFWNFFWINLVVGLIAGMVGGTILVKINDQLFRKRSFGFALATTAISYLLVYLFITIVISTGVAFRIFGSDVGLADILSIIVEYILSPALAANVVLWGVIVLLTLFLLQVNDKFGPGILKKFLLGQYHHPKKEERIFMFLDMKSSTKIAEQIGHNDYFKLLKDVFSDITQPIIESEGEIYQYVGDEVVISWTMKRGIDKANCYTCFEKIQNKLASLSNQYMEKYGISPEFKAGVHCGIVTAGEIDRIKKDIVYSGDVLNATSRIQELCNQHKVNLILSKTVIDQLSSNVLKGKRTLGEFALRGKNEKLELLTLGG